MHAVKLTQIGNSVGLVLPKEALAKLAAKKGDVVYVTDGPGGSLILSSYDDRVAQQVALGEGIMDEYKDTFRALAK